MTNVPTSSRPRISLWTLGGLSPWRLGVRIVQDYQRNHLSAHCAQFAYYSLLCLPPLLMLILAATAQLPWEGIVEAFLRVADVGLPHDVANLITSQVGDIRARTTWGVVAASGLMLAVAGTRLFLSLGAGLDAAFGIVERRRFWRARGLSLALTLLVFLTSVIAMVLLVVGPSVAGFVADRIDVPWVRIASSAGVRWGVACGFVLLATSVIYWRVPSERQSWHWLSPGSLFATAGWVLVSQGFRVFVENFGRYNQTYGALAGVILLLIWLYMTGSTLLLGGQINGAIYRASRGR